MGWCFLESKHVNSCICQLGYPLMWSVAWNKDSFLLLCLPLSCFFLSINKYLLNTHDVKYCARHCNPALEDTASLVLGPT